MTRLSPRQREVLALLEQGFYLKEIGPRCVPPISINTVKKHVGNVLRKVGANNGREALWKLRYASRECLLPIRAIIQ